MFPATQESFAAARVRAIPRAAPGWHGQTQPKHRDSRKRASLNWDLSEALRRRALAPAYRVKAQPVICSRGRPPVAPERHRRFRGFVRELRAKFPDFGQDRGGPFGELGLSQPRCRSYFTRHRRTFRPHHVKNE